MWQLAVDLGASLAGGGARRRRAGTARGVPDEVTPEVIMQMATSVRAL